MSAKTKHTEKFVDITCLCLKAPRWNVIIVNNQMDQERLDKEKAKPLEYQNPHLISYLMKSIYKRKQELKSYNSKFN